MTEEHRKQLIERGRPDLIEIWEINQSGYAGINAPDGGIVDRRKFPKAIPVQENALLGIPKPKKLIKVRVTFEGTPTERQSKAINDLIVAAGKELEQLPPEPEKFTFTVRVAKQYDNTYCAWLEEYPNDIVSADSREYCLLELSNVFATKLLQP